MLVDRAGLQDRLARAHAALSEDEDLSYRHALQLHRSSKNLLKEIKERVEVNSNASRACSHLMTAMIVLYKQEMESIGMSSVGCSNEKGKISPHFVHFAINHLPEGAPLKAMLSDWLRYWRINYPTKAIVPVCQYSGKPVTSAERPR